MDYENEQIVNVHLLIEKLSKLGMNTEPMLDFLENIVEQRTSS